MSVLAVAAAITELAIVANDITTTIVKANEMAANGDTDGALKMLKSAQERYGQASDEYRNTPNPQGDAGS